LLKDILRHKYIINHTGTIRGIANVVTKNISKDSPIENSLLVIYAKIKKLFSPHVKILINTNVDYQRVKLEKTFFGFKKDLFICVTYNPPISSKYTQELKHDILDCIEKDITP
jgi:hypothetical protein